MKKNTVIEVHVLDDPQIDQVLNLSTVHLKEEDAKTLSSLLDVDEHLPIYPIFGDGWMVYIGDIRKSWGCMSEEFIKVLLSARAANCHYVFFNPNGRTYYELPVWSS